MMNAYRHEQYQSYTIYNEVNITRDKYVNRFNEIAENGRLIEWQTEIGFSTVQFIFWHAIVLYLFCIENA